MNNLEAEPSRYQEAEKLISSFMNTLGFQTFLLTTEAEPRGIQSIKNNLLVPNKKQVIPAKAGIRLVQ